MQIYKIVEIEDGSCKPMSMGTNNIETVIYYSSNLPTDVRELTKLLYDKVYKYHDFDSGECLHLSNTLINERVVQLNRFTKLAIFSVQVNTFNNFKL